MKKGSKTSIEGSNSAKSSQVDGQHYSSLKVQPIELILACNLDFIDGNIVKYAVRRKKGEDDRIRYEKIKHYCELALELKCGSKQLD